MIYKRIERKLSSYSWVEAAKNGEYSPRTQVRIRYTAGRSNTVRVYRMCGTEVLHSATLWSPGYFERVK